MEKLKLSVDDIKDATGESRNVIADAIKCGDLVTFIVGRRRFALPQDVVAWITLLKAKSDAGTPRRYRARAEAERPEHDTSVALLPSPRRRGRPPKAKPKQPEETA